MVWAERSSFIVMFGGAYSNDWALKDFLVNDQRDAQIPFYVFIFYL
jgi:hypothetical protein